MTTVHHRYAAVEGRQIFYRHAGPPGAPVIVLLHGYGAPVGWRLALSDPAAVTAIVTQNGNGYEAGFTEAFWKPVREYWQEQNPQTEEAAREALTMDAIRWQYLHGVPDESVVSPDTWQHDFAQVSRPGNDRIQLKLFADYASNIPLYPYLHAYLRDSRVPLLAVWGRPLPARKPPRRDG
jgi:pimeloyl-ACP methyl ester carboxylesterase